MASKQDVSSGGGHQSKAQLVTCLLTTMLPIALQMRRNSAVTLRAATAEQRKKAEAAFDRANECLLRCLQVRERAAVFSLSLSLSHRLPPLPEGTGQLAAL